MSEGQVEKVTAPSLMISAADDIVLRPELTIGMEQYVPDLEKHVIPDCGHWTLLTALWTQLWTSMWTVLAPGPYSCICTSRRSTRLRRSLRR